MRTARGRAKTLTALGIITMLFGALMVVAPSASATQGEVHRVTICHRTNAVTNPYVTPTVDFSGGDGAIVHGPNHYEHQDDVGDVFDFDAADAPDYDGTYPKPRNGEQWEDIIPPVPYGEGEWSEDGSTWSGAFTEGLNWDDEGKAIYFGSAGPWPAQNEAFYDQPFEAACGAPGEDPPVVIVEKDVPNAEVDDLFNFSISSQEDDFELGDGDNEEFAVEPGEITVGEDLTDPDGFTLTGAVCTLTSAEFPEGTVLSTALDDGEVTFEIGNEEVVECVFTNVPDTAPTYSASLVKTNNANGTGDYTDDETAPAAGADVPFMVVITNTGTGNLKVDGLSDNWPGLVTPVNLLTLGAGELVCTTPDGGDDGSEPDAFVMAVDAVILPGASNAVTCLFTLDDYSPAAAGGSVTNTVTLDTEEADDVSDTSIVRTPGGGCVGICGPVIIPDPDPVPANLAIAKAVTGEVPETWSFSFDNDVLGDFVLTNENDSTSDEVDAGEYMITEAASDDAELVSIECSGTDAEVVDLDAGTVTVDLAEGDSVSCTFTNDFPEVEPSVVVNPPAPAVAPPAVLGSQVVRSLPRTGSSSQTLATVGAMLILFGAVITLGSRRKLALER